MSFIKFAASTANSWSCIDVQKIAAVEQSPGDNGTCRITTINARLPFVVKGSLDTVMTTIQTQLKADYDASKTTNGIVLVVPLFGG